MSKYEQWCNGWHSLYIDQCGERAFREKKINKTLQLKKDCKQQTDLITIYHLLFIFHKSFFTELPWVTWGAARLGTLIHPRLFFLRDVQTCCRRKADSNTEGHGLEKVNALHNVCKQDQNRRPNGSPKVFTMSDEVLRRSGISVWPWLQSLILDVDIGLQTADQACRRHLLRYIGYTLHHFISTADASVSYFYVPCSYSARTGHRSNTLSSFSSDLRYEPARDASSYRRNHTFAASLDNHQEQMRLKSFSCIPPHHRPHSKAPRIHGGLWIRISCNLCEMWASLFQTSRALHASCRSCLMRFWAESQISRRRAPIWNDSLATAEECARLFKTSFTLKEVDKKYQKLRFTTLFSNGLPWFSSLFFLKAPGYE